MADRRSDDLERKPKKRRRSEPQKQAQTEPELQAKNHDQERLGNMALIAAAAGDKILAEPPPAPRGAERLSELLYGGDVPPDGGPNRTEEEAPRLWRRPRTPKPPPTAEDIEKFGDPITEPALPEPDSDRLDRLPRPDGAPRTLYEFLQPPPPEVGSRHRWIRAATQWLAALDADSARVRAATPPASCWSTPDGRLLPAVLASCALLTESLAQQLNPAPDLAPQVAVGLAIRSAICDSSRTPETGPPSKHAPDPWVRDCILQRLSLSPLVIPQAPPDPEPTEDCDDDPLGLDAVLEGFLPREASSRDPHREFYSDHAARVAQWLVRLEEGSDAIVFAASRYFPGPQLDGAHARMLEQTESIARILHEIGTAADGDVVPTRGLQRGFERIIPMLNQAHLAFANGVAAAASEWLEDTTIPAGSSAGEPLSGATRAALEAAVLGHPPHTIVALLADQAEPDAVRLRAALGAEGTAAIEALFRDEIARRNGVGAAHAALLWLDALARAGQGTSDTLDHALEELAALEADAALDLLSRYAAPGETPDQVG